MDRIGAMEQRMMEQLRDAQRVSQETILKLGEDFNVLRVEWAKEKTELRKYVADLEKRVIALESRDVLKDGEDRRSNFIITGKIPDRRRNVFENVEGFLKEEVSVDARIRDVTVLQERNETREMKIRVKMDSYQDKMAVMNQKWRLRNMRGGVVYIDDDLTVKQREVQKMIRDKAKEERNRGKSVRIGFQRLCVDGKWMTVEEGIFKELRRNSSNGERNKTNKRI